MSSDMQETYFGLKFLHDSALARNEFPFKKIFDLETLVVNLGKHCNIDFSAGSAKDLLTSYAFDYTPKSRCAFHEDLGITQCSLGLVKKTAFLISDNICHSYDIELTTKHVPTQVAISTVTHIGGFAASSCTQVPLLIETSARDTIKTIFLMIMMMQKQFQIGQSALQLIRKYQLLNQEIYQVNKLVIL